jgi:CheY-like chemotaxis protein
MDCHMPNMDGFQCTRLIRNSQSMNRDVPIIALTADAMNEARQKCIESGMNDYLTKPITLERLEKMLWQWLPSNNAAPLLSISDQETGANSDPLASGNDSGEIMALLNRTYGPQPTLKLLKLFLSSTPPLLERLRTASRDRDSHALSESAHELKGACAALHLETLQSHVYELEAMGKRHSPDWIMAQSALTITEAEFSRWWHEIQGWITNDNTIQFDSSKVIKEN